MNANITQWGEVAFRKLVELAKMSPHCDFTMEVMPEGGHLRPDMIVHLPGGHFIVIDVKLPLGALIDALEASNEEAKMRALKQHTLQIKKYLTTLRSDNYWRQFVRPPELVVAFIPEVALTTALEIYPTFIEESISKRVIIATPITLFALLTTIAHGWQKGDVTKDEEAIASTSKELYEQMNIWAKQVEDSQFVICIKNDDYPASLEIRKIYQVVEDITSSKHRLIRIIDESGEDYLYPKDYFIPIVMPKIVEEILSTSEK